MVENNMGNDDKLFEMYKNYKITFNGDIVSLGRFIRGPLANVKVTDKKGNTLLHLIFLNSYFRYLRNRERLNTEENIELLEWLIKMGVDINKENANGLTSLEYAINFGDEQSACFLMDNGAEFLEQRKFLNTRPIYDMGINSFPFFRAVSLNREVVVRKMIEKGIELNTRILNLSVVDYIETKQMYQLFEEYKELFDDELHLLFKRKRLKYVI